MIASYELGDPLIVEAEASVATRGFRVDSALLACRRHSPCSGIFYLCTSALWKKHGIPPDFAAQPHVWWAHSSLRRGNWRRSPEFFLSLHISPLEEARHPAGPHAGVISYGAAVDLRTYLTKKNLAAA
jgi:hypothetical protein